MEDDDIAAADVAVGQQAVPSGAAAVAKFIHQQIVADQQRLLHGFRRDRERLYQEGDRENGDHHRFRDRLNRRRPIPSGNLFAPRHNYDIA